MTSFAISGWGMVSAAGVGRKRFADAFDAPDGPVDVSGMYDDLPPGPAYALPSFNARELLGRKGTSFLDRATAMALVACEEALADSGLPLDRADRVGVTLGTTVGSLRSTSDYSRETLVAEKPYLVNPVLFPNTVMNCAAGQAGIRFGLRGVNATIAGGRLALLNALSYATGLLRRDHADALLVGSVEEFTPHTAWLTRLSTPDSVPGEAAGVFVVEPLDTAVAAGRRVDAEVLAVATGFAPGGEITAALATCVATALDRAGVAASEVRFVATGEASDRLESATLPDAERILVQESFGECHAGTGALQLAALLVTLGRAGSGTVGVLTGHTRRGGVGAAVIKGATACPR